MALSAVVDHIVRMLDNRIEEFRSAVRFSSLVSLFGQQIQDIEDGLYQLITDRTLDTAEGAQLDGIGQLVGEDRAGRTDAPYRLALRTRIALNLSQGTAEDLIAVALAISGGTQAELEEYFPAAFEIRVLDPVPSGTDPGTIGAFVNSAKPAGVGATTVIHVSPPFQFDTGSGFDEGKYAVAV